MTHDPADTCRSDLKGSEPLGRYHWLHQIDRIIGRIVHQPPKKTVEVAEAEGGGGRWLGSGGGGVRWVGSEGGGGRCLGSEGGVRWLGCVCGASAHEQETLGVLGEVK